MIAKIMSSGIMGIESYPVEIEVDVSEGLPQVNLVGLADTAIKESRIRVKSAIKNSGFCWPRDKIAISLAPSDIKKDGTGFDLAIAMGILCATEQINFKNISSYCILGELSLDGSLRPIKGVLSIAMNLVKSNIRNIILPYQNAQEAALVPGINVWPLRNLKQTVEFMNTPELIPPFKVETENIFQESSKFQIDFSEVKGQFAAKRAVEIAVSGGHNIIFIGPPGSGKTMLAKRIPTVLPDLTVSEALEVTKIHSATRNIFSENSFIAKPPFRSPHHTISYPALVGGGSNPQPGEISLAHRGVLFLDELPEFQRGCLEALRQPLEDGSIKISRMNATMNFPASFMLVCAMNPCMCGGLGRLKSSCRCSPSQIHKYRSKISGPLLDRIDIHVEVNATRYQDLASKQISETSSQIKERILKARSAQKERFKTAGISLNSQMDHKQVHKFCALGDDENKLLKNAMSELNFSARAYDKILKISRTIADLAGLEKIRIEHLAEAIQYRSLDRNFFI